MSYESRTGTVLFANSVDRVASFYAHVIGLDEMHRDDDHILLESPGFQLVVHRIPGRPGRDGGVAVPPVRRTTAAFKPVFFVQSLARIRNIAAAHGGGMEPSDKEWYTTASWCAMRLTPRATSSSSARWDAECHEGGRGEGGATRV